MQVGMGFWPSKTLLSAVELRLFTLLGSAPLTAAEIADELELRSRAVFDFLDGLVALRLLEREGSGETAGTRTRPRPRCSSTRNSPHYIGGILEMANARLYGFWDGLTEALRTGEPQNEIKHTGKSMFEELYADPERLEQFMRGDVGHLARQLHGARRRRSTSPRTRRVCDVGGATGQLSIILAERHPHLQLRELRPAGRRAHRASARIAAAGLADRVSTRVG